MFIPKVVLIIPYLRGSINRFFLYFFRSKLRFKLRAIPKGLKFLIKLLIQNSISNAFILAKGNDFYKEILNIVLKELKSKFLE